VRIVARTSNHQGLLGERLNDLQSWLTSALEIYELRDAETVRKAKAAFLKWACEVWDRSSGDVDGALTFAHEGYIECAPSWAESDSAFYADFPCFANPAWELAEFHLLVASTLADGAISAFDVGTKKQMALAAMLYADAVEAREDWRHLRGPGGARNKDTRIGETFRYVEEAFKRREQAIVRKVRARDAAMVKLARDPKQAAKAEAFKLWQERHAGKHPKLRTNEQFAGECMDRWPVLTSVKVICGWCTDWTKAAKSQRAS
jgi:hypothetical protein